MTKLGRLVKDGKIKRLEDIYLFSMPIKVDFAKKSSKHLYSPVHNSSWSVGVVNTLFVSVPRMTVAFTS